MAATNEAPIVQEDLRAEAEQIMWIEGAISAAESAPPLRNWPPTAHAEEAVEL